MAGDRRLQIRLVIQDDGSAVIDKVNSKLNRVGASAESALKGITAAFKQQGIYFSSTASRLHTMGNLYSEVLGHRFKTAGESAGKAAGTAAVKAFNTEMKKMQVANRAEDAKFAASLSSGISTALVGVGAAGTTAAAGLSLYTKSLIDLSTVSIKATADFEQNHMALATMTGSAEKATMFLRELEAFSARTPFEFTQLLASTRLMTAFGIETQKVIPMLTNIGDAAAALGLGPEKIQLITLALGQMTAKGKVSGEEMRQLAENGIRGWQYLADAAGKSIEEIQDLSEKGMLDAKAAVNVILAGMNRDFGGMVDVQSQTINGKLSTLKDNIGFSLRDMGDTLKNPFKEGLGAISEEFDKLRKEGVIKSFMQQVGDDALTFLVPVVQIMGAMLKAGLVLRQSVVGISQRNTEENLRAAEDTLRQMKGGTGQLPTIKTLTATPEKIAAQEEEVRRLRIEYDNINRSVTQTQLIYANLEESIANVEKRLVDTITQQREFAGVSNEVAEALGAIPKPIEKSAELIALEQREMNAFYAELNKNQTDLIRKGDADKKKAEEDSKNRAIDTAKFMEQEFEEERKKFKAHLDAMARVEEQMGRQSLDAAIARETYRARVQRDMDLFNASEIQKVDEQLEKDRIASMERLAEETARFGEEEFEAQRELYEKLAELTTVEYPEAVQASRERMAEGWRRFADENAFTMGNMQMLGLDVASSISDGFGRAFADTIIRGKSFAASIKALFADIASYVIAKLASMAIVNLFTGGGGMLGGLFGKSPVGDFGGIPGGIPTDVATARGALAPSVTRIERVSTFLAPQPQPRSEGVVMLSERQIGKVFFDGGRDGSLRLATT